MLPNDTLSRVLAIDLTRREFSVENRPELFDECLGGAGVAIRLLDESLTGNRKPYVSFFQSQRGASTRGPANGLSSGENIEMNLAGGELGRFKSARRRNRKCRAEQSTFLGRVTVEHDVWQPFFFGSHIALGQSKGLGDFGLDHRSGRKRRGREQRQSPHRRAPGGGNDRRIHHSGAGCRGG